jgi:hypothetical protein
VGFLAGGVAFELASFLAGRLSDWQAFWQVGFLDSHVIAMSGLNYNSLRWVF